MKEAVGLRKITCINQNWQFLKADIAPEQAVQYAAQGEKVTLPHTWNASDGQDGGNDYHRGRCWYIRRLTEEETGLLHKAADLILSGKTIACTACNYCGPGCPQNIPIPKYFSLYNGDKLEIIGKSWTPNKGLYQKLTESFGKASDCIECGQCENMCPQHLPIIKYLKDVAEYMENA